MPSKKRNLSRSASAENVALWSLSGVFLASCSGGGGSVDLKPIDDTVGSIADLGLGTNNNDGGGSNVRRTDLTNVDGHSPAYHGGNVNFFAMRTEHDAEVFSNRLILIDPQGSASTINLYAQPLESENDPGAFTEELVTVAPIGMASDDPNHPTAHRITTKYGVLWFEESADEFEGDGYVLYWKYLPSDPAADVFDTTLTHDYIRLRLEDSDGNERTPETRNVVLNDGRTVPVTIGLLTFTINGVNDPIAITMPASDPSKSLTVTANTFTVAMTENEDATIPTDYHSFTFADEETAFGDIVISHGGATDLIATTHDSEMMRKMMIKGSGMYGDFEIYRTASGVVVWRYVLDNSTLVAVDGGSPVYDNLTLTLTDTGLENTDPNNGVLGARVGALPQQVSLSIEITGIPEPTPPPVGGNMKPEVLMSGQDTTSVLVGTSLEGSTGSTPATIYFRDPDADDLPSTLTFQAEVLYDHDSDGIKTLQFVTIDTSKLETSFDTNGYGIIRFNQLAHNDATGIGSIAWYYQTDPVDLNTGFARDTVLTPGYPTGHPSPPFGFTEGGGAIEMIRIRIFDNEVGTPGMVDENLTLYLTGHDDYAKFTSTRARPDQPILDRNNPSQEVSPPNPATSLGDHRVDSGTAGTGSLTYRDADSADSGVIFRVDGTALDFSSGSARLTTTLGTFTFTRMDNDTNADMNNDGKIDPSTLSWEYTADQAAGQALTRLDMEEISLVIQGQFPTSVNDRATVTVNVNPAVSVTGGSGNLAPSDTSIMGASVSWHAINASSTFRVWEVPDGGTPGFVALNTTLAAELTPDAGHKIETEHGEISFFNYSASPFSVVTWQYTPSASRPAAGTMDEIDLQVTDNEGYIGEAEITINFVAGGGVQSGSSEASVGAIDYSGDLGYASDMI